VPRERLINTIRASFHEAGHALTAMRWVGGVTKATLGLREGGELGGVEVRSRDVSIEGYVAFIMGGYAGERVRGYPEHNDVRALRLLRKHRRAGEQLIESDLTDDAAVVLRELRTHAPHLAGPPSAIAGYQRALSFLSRYRDVMYDVAAALRARGTLDGTTICSIVADRIGEVRP
jgi:hypothetical protein